MSKTIVAAAIAGGLILSLSAAGAGVLAPVLPFPGATQTFAYGINNDNVIAGRYVNSDGSQHGFFGTLDGNYTSFDFPGGDSFVTSINDEGDITGESEALTDDCPLLGCEYLRKANGHMVEIRKDRSALDGQAEQIIKNQKFVGEYWFIDDQQNIHTNGYRGHNGHWIHDIVLPFDNVARTRPRGYNRKGEIVGFYTAGPAGGGFVLKGGVATSVTFPDADATTTLLAGLNGKGKIVGSWSNSNGTEGQAFIYESDKDSFRVIDVPGETVTAARQVNDAGVTTILGAAGSYIYCTHKPGCPITAGAIEVSETVVPARHPGNTQWVVCKNGCMRDVSATHKAASPAAVREAIKRDPSLALEMRDFLR